MALGASRAAAAAFAIGVIVDLASKIWAVSYDSGVIYHDEASRMAIRLVGCALTVAGVAALSAYAAKRGFGRQFGLWIGCGLAVAGILANGVSSMLWASGVPDFIPAGGGWIWNVADFEIVLGLGGGLVSLAVAAVAAYVRTVRAS
jgi:hypothetical protein